jgi:hypothetical protein
MEEKMDDYANDETTETEQLVQLPTVADYAPSSALVLAEAYKAAGTMRLTEEQEAILLAPVDPENDVELHLIDGPYIPWIKYTQRLNKAFGLMGWARLRMGEPDFDPESMTAAVRVALKIEGRVVRDAVGECKQGSKKMTRFDCLEGAMKNGLKRCCSDLGMFAELQDRRWRERWLTTYAHRVKKDGYDQWERLPLVPAPTPVQPQMPPPSVRKADLPQATDLKEYRPLTISDGQRRRLFAIATKAGVDSALLKLFLAETLHIESSKDILIEQYDTLISMIEDGDVLAWQQRGQEKDNA